MYIDACIEKYLLLAIFYYQQTYLFYRQILVSKTEFKIAEIQNQLEGIESSRFKELKVFFDTQTKMNKWTRIMVVGKMEVKIEKKKREVKIMS